MTVSAQTEPLFVESPEYLTALKLAESDVRMNCFAFKTLWLTLFPDAKCYRYKTNIGTMHWECPLGDKLIIDSNYRLDSVIRIRQK